MRRDRILAGLEAAFVLAFLLCYIWLVERSPRSATWPYYAFFFLFTFASHRMHGDTRADLGLRLDNLARSLAEAIAVFAPSLVLAIVIGSFLGGGRPEGPARLIASCAAAYPWSLFQQYGLQCFFGRRLAAVVRRPVGRDLLCAGIFSALHLPNPFLVIVTFGSGYCWSVLFRRCPNLFALAASHAISTSVLSSFVPPSITGLMRVGPGYFSALGLL